MQTRASVVVVVLLVTRLTESLVFFSSRNLARKENCLCSAVSEGGNTLIDSEEGEKKQAGLPATATKEKKPKKKKKEESAWKSSWRSDVARWYILQVYTGQEQSVAAMLNLAVSERPAVAARVEELVVPIEKVAGVRGKKVTAKSKIVYPGYIFVRIQMNKDIWELFTKAPKVMNFIGIDPGRRNGIGDVVPGYRGDVVPLPLLDEEAERMLSIVARTHTEIEELAATFAIGDAIAVTAGPHAGERGLIRTVKHGELVVALIGGPTTFNVAIDPKCMRKLTPKEAKAAQAQQDPTQAKPPVAAQKEENDQIIYGSANQDAELRARREKKRKLQIDASAKDQKAETKSRPSRWEAKAAAAASSKTMQDEDLLMSFLSDDIDTVVTEKEHDEEDLSFLDDLLNDDDTEAPAAAPVQQVSAADANEKLDDLSFLDDLLTEEEPSASQKKTTQFPDDIFADDSLFADDETNDDTAFDKVLMDLEKDFESGGNNAKDVDFLTEDEDDEHFLKNFLSDVGDQLHGDTDDDDDEFLRMLGLGDDDDDNDLLTDISADSSLSTSSLKESQVEDDLFADIISGDDDESFDASYQDVAPLPTESASSITAPDLSSMTVPQLKELLKSRGLKVSGRKADLVARLAEDNDDTR